jgi:hypothetical protein
MEFVNPGFLYGLFAISIPIIIHLFNFRRFKKVYFSNVSFIRELKLQTQKQSRLKHLLILLMRILAVASIVIAFAQPYFPVSKNIIQPDEKNAISIYIDNSFSMQAVSEKGILLDDAKEKSREIAFVYKDSDLFQLLTNDFEGRNQRFVSKEEFIDRIDEVQISPVVKALPEVISRQQQLLSEHSSNVKTAYIISDFQKGIMKSNFSDMDTSINKVLIPVEGINTDNLYIDSCWLETPVHQLYQNTGLFVKIRNSSARNFEKIPLKLLINDKQRAVASFDIKANESAELTIPFTDNEVGIQNGELSISDFSITFDDQLWFSYFVDTETPILCINGNAENAFLNSLFKKDSLFIYENVNEGSIAYSDFNRFKLIILNELSSVSSGLTQQIIPFVQNGGSLILLPSSRTGGQDYNELLKLIKAGSYGPLDTTNTRISFINLEHPLYANVFDEIPENIDLPIVYQYYPILIDNRTRHEPLLELQRGGNFLSVFQFDKGKVYLFAVPFDPSFSNFPKHAIFVPTLYKIAVSSILEENLYYTIGKNEMITLRNVDLGSEEVVHLKALHSDFDIIPELRRGSGSTNIFVYEQIRQAGNYEIFIENKPIKGVSFNYDRTESEMNFFNKDMLQDFIRENKLKNMQIIDTSDKPFVQTITELSQGIRLWKLFVILALAFLLAESLLLRFLK